MIQRAETRDGANEVISGQPDTGDIGGAGDEGRRMAARHSK